MPESFTSTALLADTLKQRLAKKALISAGVALLPIPLLDLAVDAVLLRKLLVEVNESFGLSHAQVESMPTTTKVAAYSAVTLVGSRIIGKVVTQAVVLSVMKTIGLRLGAKEISKIVPIAGQIASASLSYAAMRYVVNKHIDDCVKVLGILENDAQGQPLIKPA